MRFFRIRLAFVLFFLMLLSAALPTVSASSDAETRLSEFNRLAGTSYSYSTPLTREDFCVAVAKLFNNGRTSEVSPPFEDVSDVRSESLPFLAALYEDGLLMGVDARGMLYMHPNAPMTRQEAVTFLGRVLGRTSYNAMIFTDADMIAPYAYEYIAWFVDWGLIVGYPDGSFGPGNHMNAGELAFLSTRVLDHQKRDMAQISTYSGTGGQGLADGGRQQARFTLPSGLLVDSSGTVTVFDTYNNAIRRIDNTGVQTMTGKSVRIDDHGFPYGAFQDGALNTALLNRPADGVIDSKGNLLIADSQNHVIRIIYDNEMYTFCGSDRGYADGSHDRARFDTPMALAIDSNDNVYVADTLNNCIRMIDARGNVSTIAGVAGREGFLDGATGSALFRAPSGIAVSPDGGVIYVADTGNHLIRKIENGRVTTLAGRFDSSSNDGEPLGGFRNGPGTSSLFLLPGGIAYYDGDIYVADSGNHMIRVITAEGVVFTVAGNGEPGDRDGSALGAVLNAPGGVSVVDGAIYVADTGNNKVKVVALA